MAEASKLDMKSMSITEDQKAKLKQILPEVFNKDKIDFDKLRLTLGEEVDTGEERFGMTWPGKSECFKVIQEPSIATLKPCKKESIDWDMTENLFIEGDNLEVLKLLQRAYYGKVKMIYIDPPYNTGNQFIYPDKHSESLETYLAYTGQVDAEGVKFSTNTESEGRFHSKWMSMMYPRLFLARNLLREDGVIFISIGDDEVANLKQMCNEIFGEENFCAKLIWNTEGNTDNQYKIKVNHEYILVYFKDASCSEAAIGKVIDPNTPEDSNLRKGYADNNINKNNPENPVTILELPAGFPCSEETLFYPAKEVDEAFFEKTKREKFISDEVKQKYGIEHKSGLPVKLDDMVVENYKLVKPCRIYVGMANKKKLLEFITNDCHEIMDEGLPVKFYINSNAAIRYRKLNENPRNILSVLRNMGTTEKSKTYLRRMGVYYDYPKPVGLIKYLLQIGCDSRSGIVLDFFAGSSTTEEALLELEAQDELGRKFILVQLPETLDPKKKEQKASYQFCIDNNIPTNIAEISKERIRRVIRQFKKDKYPGDKLPGMGGDQSEIDIGFRVYKLATSSFAIWDGTIEEDKELSKQIEMFIDHIDSESGDEDILYEILLKAGFELTTKIKELNLAGKKVYSITNNALLICLERKLSKEVITEMARLQPARVVCLDVGFADNDQLKTNAVQIMKSHEVEDFRTV